jgi:hypothetical protein
MNVPSSCAPVRQIRKPQNARTCVADRQIYDPVGRLRVRPARTCRQATIAFASFGDSAHPVVDEMLRALVSLRASRAAQAQGCG